MNLETSLGIVRDGNGNRLGTHPEVFRFAAEMIDQFQDHGGPSAGQQGPRGPNGRCPADRRIEAFLNDHFADLGLEPPLRLPASTLVLTRHGIARALSLPEGENLHSNPIVHSYRVRNGVLHNPISDRRTTLQARSTSPRAYCRSRRQEGRSPRDLRRPSSATRSCQPPGAVGRAVHGGPRRSRCAGVRLAPAPPGRLPRAVPGVCGARRWRSAFSRRDRWSATWTSWNRSLAMPATRLAAQERRRARRRTLDGPHRLRHPRPAPDPALQEGPGPPRLVRRHGAAAARRDVLARGRRGV